MRIKYLLITIVGIFTLSPAIAQDRLYKKNGEMIQVKIKEVGTRTITYKKFDSEGGPDYIIGKNEVSRIKYANGDEDEISNDRPLKEGRREAGPGSGHLSDAKYGKNILAISPIVMTNTSVTGFGLSYERVLDRNNIFSVYLPFAYSFQTNDDYDYTTNYNSGKDHMFWAYPGIKVYPTGSNRVVSYALGISLPIGSGIETVYTAVYNPQTGNYENGATDDNIFIMGGMLTNYLNIQPTEDLYLGLEFGLGIPYVNDHDLNINSDRAPYGNVPLVQFSFRAGFRF